VVQGFEMRVGDAEREAAAAELREHFASGRLTQDELNERLDKAFAAKTRGDLHALMIDLPSAHPGWSAAGAADSGAGFGGSGARWIGQGAGDGGRPGDTGDGGQCGGRRTAGTMVASFVMMWALLALGIIGVFGMGGGRPFGIVLIVAAFALLRRLLFFIFGRRRGGRRGPRRRRW
jgi:uncharacterized protein DUF1707